MLPGKRIDINVTGYKKASLGGNYYVNVKRDYNSGHLDVTPLKKKSKVVEDTILYLTKLKEKFGYYPDYIRKDNSGENIKLSEEVKKSVSTQIKFEFVSKNTPKKKWIGRKRYHNYLGKK